jgi:hypothetical protein
VHEPMRPTSDAADGHLLPLIGRALAHKALPPMRSLAAPTNRKVAHRRFSVTPDQVPDSESSSWPGGGYAEMRNVLNPGLLEIANARVPD